MRKYKYSKQSRAVALWYSLACCGLYSNAQTFVLDSAASGGLNLSVGTPISGGGIGVSFSHLHETVVLDPVNQTARQIGTVTSNPTASGFVINENQLVPSTFPNPPVSVAATISISLSLADGDINFDTGANPATWDAAAQAYSINGQLGNIPIMGSYSMSTGGKTYSGSFNYYLFPILGSAFTYRRLDTSGYPDHVALSVTGQEGGFFTYHPSTNTVADVVADNGFHLVLSPGDAGFSWSAANSIANAPEPSEYATGVSVLLAGFAFMRKRWNYSVK